MIRRNFYIATGILLLTACETLNTPYQSQTPAKAEAMYQDGRYRQAAVQFERLARDTGGAPREALLNQAALSWIKAQRLEQAMKNFRQKSAPLDAQAPPELQLLASVQALNQEQPYEAIARLDGIQKELSPELQAVALEVIGRAQFALKDTQSAINAFIARETWLESESDIEENHELLWQLLNQVEMVEIPEQPLIDAEVLGWLKLTNIVRNDDPFAAESELNNWQLEFPNHPALDDVFQNLVGEFDNLGRLPQRIALLLPLSGPLESAAKPLRDGFFFALDEFPGTSKPVVRVYDTAVMGADIAYRKAVMEGADFIVGPLEKDAVAATVFVSDARVGQLALNSIAEEFVPHKRFFQFALAPEHGAENAAQRALAENQLTALVLGPETDWGTRVVDAFIRSFEEGGGVILDYRLFSPVEKNQTEVVRQLLGVEESIQRKRGVENILGERVDFEARRRRDVDVIFIAASETEGRLLKPLLDYHYANDLPVYSTAAIFNPAGRGLRDIRNVRFAEMPWVAYAGSPRYEKFEPILSAENFSHARSRLFAMGYDAFRLVPLLYDQRKPLHRPLQGLTGLLSLREDQSVFRQLEFVAVSGDSLVILPAIEVPEAAKEDYSALPR